jgi:hypothetical protein
MYPYKPSLPTSKNAFKYVEGKKVSHAKFGIGVIEKKLGKMVLRVTFENHVTKNIRCDFLSLI